MNHNELHTKQESFLSKRLIDLSRQAQNKGIVTFSDFLNLNELNIYSQSVKEYYCKQETFGGYDFAERQMIAFIPDALLTFTYPVVCIKIQPKNNKFADKLTHRDILGSLMNLGIERSTLGDILVDSPNAFVFCNESISDFIINYLEKIKHTAVKCQRTDSQQINIKQDVTQAEGIIASVRLDCIISCMCKISRKEALQQIKSGKVFIFNKEITNNAMTCRENDLISVRSFGRFRFLRIVTETKKGRIKIQYEIFK